MFSWLVKRWAKDAVAKVLRDELPGMIDRKIEEVLSDMFTKEPAIKLTPVGFHWAFYLALKKLWPDIDLQTSARWLRDYLAHPIGSKGYEWTPHAASDLARQYASEFGER